VTTNDIKSVIKRKLAREAKRAHKAKADAALVAVDHFNVKVHTADRDGGSYPVNRAAARELFSHKRR
jgi:hypothetical protein